MAGKVSVIIPTFNRAEYLAASLESVLSQTVSPHQVIVVNDGSTDETDSVLQPFIEQIEYICKKNSGKADSVNLALRNVTGDYVWVFDDDDIALPHFIECQTGLLDNDPSLGFTYSNFCFGLDHDGELIAGRENEMPDVPASEIHINLLISCFFRHTAMIIRRECYGQLGGLDATLIRSQDYYFQILVAQMFEGVGINEPTMIFRRHDGARGSGEARHNSIERDRIHLSFDKIAFRNVHAKFDLQDYLPKGRGDKPLHALDRREALILKGVSMALRALWDEGTEAFKRAASEDNKTPLSKQERKFLSKLFSSPLALAELRAIKSERMTLRSIMRNSVVGSYKYTMLLHFYFGFVNDLESKHWRRATQNLMIMLSIIRLRDIYWAVWQKIWSDN